MGKEQEEISKEQEQEQLVDFYAKKHYGGQHKEKIKEKLLSDKNLFDHALQEIHKDKYPDLKFDDFKTKYESVYGSPFPEKKNPSGDESKSGSSTGISKEDKDLVSAPLPDQNGFMAGETNASQFHAPKQTVNQVDQLINEDKSSIKKEASKDPLYQTYSPNEAAHKAAEELNLGVKDRLDKINSIVNQSPLFGGNVDLQSADAEEYRKQVDSLHSEASSLQQQLNDLRKQHKDPYLGMTDAERKKTIEDSKLKQKYSGEVKSTLNYFGFSKKEDADKINLTPKQQDAAKNILEDFHNYYTRNYKEEIVGSKDIKEKLKDYLYSQVYPELKTSMKGYDDSILGLGGTSSERPDHLKYDEKYFSDSEELRDKMKSFLTLAIAAEYEQNPLSYLEKKGVASPATKAFLNASTGGLLGDGAADAVASTGDVIGDAVRGVLGGAVDVGAYLTGSNAPLSQFRKETTFNQPQELSQVLQQQLESKGAETPENVKQQSEGSFTDTMASTAQSSGELVPAFVITEIASGGAATEGWLAKAGQKYLQWAERAKQSGNILKKVAAYAVSGTPKVLSSGLKYEATGQVFGGANKSIKDEANFFSGVAGAIGEGVATKLFNKLAGSAQGNALLKYLTGTSGAGVGETAEEMAQTFAQIVQESNDNDELTQKLKEQFTGDNLVDLALSSFIMGSFMKGSSNGTQMLDQFKKTYESATPEQRAVIDEKINSDEPGQQTEGQLNPTGEEVQQPEGSTDISQPEESASGTAGEEVDQNIEPETQEDNATEDRNLEENSQLQHQGDSSVIQGEGDNRNVPSGKQESSSETSSSDSVQQSGGSKEDVQGKEEKVKKKERKATKKILEDPEISKELKDGIKEEAKLYIPRTDKLNNHEANSLIEYKGLEQSKSDVLDFENEMHPAVRVKMRKALIRKLDALASEARDSGNEKLEKQFRNDAIQLSEEHGTKGTDIASALQAYREHFTDKSASQHIYETEKMIKQKRKQVKNINKSEIESEVTAAKEHINESTSEVLKAKKAKAKIEKIRQKLSTEIEKPYDKNSEREKKISQKRVKAKENLQKAKDEFHSLLKEIRGQANAGLDPRLVAAASKYGYYAILDGSYKFADWSKKMVEDLGEAVKPHLEQIWDSAHDNEHLKSLANEVQIHELNKNTRREIVNNLDQKIDEIVGKHYTEVNRVKSDLTKKLMEGLNISESDAKDLAKTIESEFETLYHEKRKKTLEKKLGANPRTKVDKKLDQFHQELIKLVNMGALTDENMSELYMKKYDIPHLAEEQKAEITKMVEKVQSLPEGSQQQRAAIEKFLGYQTNLKGISKLDLAVSIWYASILSGPTTQMRNIYANTAFLLGEVIREAGYSLSKGDVNRFKLSMIGLYQGLGRGIMEAATTIKTGVSPDKTGKSEAPMLLERYNFKGGKWNPFNYAKYVGRLMSAADIFFYHGAKEMRAYQMAWAEAKAQGKDMPTEAIRDKVYEKLFKTKELRAQAEAQAKSEGLEGNEYKRRVMEIMDQKRGIEFVDETRLYALKSTFNQDPEGTLGLLTGLMSHATTRFMPLKFIVPFTRILSNVANNYIEWSPYGLVRYAKGGIGWGENLTKYNQEERTKVLISSLAGTLAFIALYSLTADDDDENGIEITSNLTGDFKKNYEINKPQYSIRIGNKWFNYQDTPLAIPLSMVGYIRDAEKYKGDKDLEERATIAAFGTFKYMSDLTFMQGLSEFFDAFAKEGSEGAQSFFKKMEKQTITIAKGAIVPNIYTQSKRIVDEAFNMPMKQADGMLAQFYRDIPIANNSMNDMVNALGEPVIPSISNRLLPFQFKYHEDNKVLDLLNDKNAFVGRLSRGQLEYQLGRAITDDQYYDFCKTRGQEIKERILKNYDKLIKMTPEDARDKISDYKEKATKSAKFEVFKKLK